MLPNNDVESKRRDAVEIATGVINGSINPIEGCRRLVWLDEDLNMENDKSFLALAGMESETDHWPLGEAKENYSPAYLQKVEKEEREYLASARDEIVQACREIIEKLSK